jgi:CobQ/CobB/MinD/ParA nucleotide binding domain.
MGKILDGIFVAFENPKGGSGKSTLTAIFAAYLHAIGQKDGLTVGVIDIDDTQNNLGGMRHRESQLDSSGEDEYTIMNISSSEVLSQVDYLKEAFDIILIDFPGNLKQDGIIETLHLVDVIIIPFEVNDMSLAPTLQFYEIYSNILETRKKNGYETTVKGVPNRVSPNVKEYKDLLDNKDSLPFELLNNHVKESKVEFQRKISTISTYYQYSAAEAFCDEVLDLITSHVKKVKEKENGKTN